MQPLARGYSFVMYLAEDAATYTIPFPYLHSENIRVFAGDVGDAVEQTITWLSNTEFKLASPVPKGILVTARRFTPRDTSLAVYHDGGQLPAADLNLNTSQLLYIIQEQLDFGTYGGNGLPGGGSGWPMPDGSEPNLAIQQIIDGVMASPIMQLLIDRIDPIDSTAETLLDEILRSDQRFNERRVIDQRVALAETSIVTLTDDTHSLAQQTTELYAQFDGAASQLIQVQQALATETEARALAITQMQSAFTDADAATTQAIYTQVAETYASKDQAQSYATQAVSAFANGSYATLENRFEALVKGNADPANNEWSANWTMRINGGAINGTPVIAGIGLGVDSKTGSNFVVMADRFAIVSPTYTTTGGVAQMKYPFVVGTVGGVSTVGITGQLIVDGSISAQKISTNSLSAISANMGTVNGGIFRTYSLDANGNVINPNEFRVELTNNPNDPWPFWIGSGVKNANNAVVWFDRSGNASFNGTIRAQNMVDQLQAQTGLSWDGDIVASTGGVTSTFVLPAPVRLGQMHTPLISLEVFLVNTDNNNKAATHVLVERLVGGTWVAVRNAFYLLRGDEQTSMAMIVTDVPTSAAEQYRVRLDGAADQHSFTLHCTAVRGFIFGLR